MPLGSELDSEGLATEGEGVARLL